MEFVAGSIDEVPGLRDALIVSVDLGFSATQRSTGIAISCAGGVRPPICLSFRAAVSATAEALRESASKAALIVEAPLSFFFSSAGNPVGRPFEKGTKPRGGGRYWYTGPGASTALAGAFFIRALAESASCDSALVSSVHVFEGFVTFKRARTRHQEDAALLLEEFTHGRVLPVAPPSDGFARTVFDLAAVRVPGSELPAIVGVRQDFATEA